MLWNMQAPERTVMLVERSQLEEAELQRGSVVKSDDELLPRQSGSKEWREERGEMGAQGGVMNMMAGHKNVQKDVKKLTLPEVQK